MGSLWSKFFFGYIVRTDHQEAVGEVYGGSFSSRIYSWRGNLKAVGEVSGANTFVACIGWTGLVEQVRKSLEQLFRHLYSLDCPR
jgi:hypothetical protein